MILKNFSSLAKTKARKAALQIIDAGIEASLVHNALSSAVSYKKGTLKIQGKKVPLKGKLYVVGFGKASIAAAKELESILGKRISSGIVLDVSEGRLKRIKVRRCTHPVVSPINVKHTKELVSLLSKATKDDTVLCVVSGGGSAILESPAIPLQKFIAVNKALLRSGAEIHDMNTVRKHLSLVKGGQLPGHANGATFVSLILSDVIGDDISFIASGPTVKDKTSAAKAKAIIKRYKLPSVPVRETPRSMPPHVRNALVLTNKTAVAAMAAKAREIGLKPIILTTAEKGEARKVGKMLARKARKGYAIIAAGETTVTVKGHGKGGRNQEVAVGALSAIGDATVASAGTDGIDNTLAAGGIVDKLTLKKNPNFLPYLKNNDVFNYLKKTGDLIITGKTGTNVADIMVSVKL